MKKELESKPEKNCGNCVNKTNWPMISHTPCNECYMGSSWRPKTAEPQGWEQRLNAMVFVLVRDGLRRGGQGHQALADIRELIRAEIEQAKKKAYEEGVEVGIIIYGQNHSRKVKISWEE